MTAECVYKQKAEPTCTRIATDNVIGSGRKDDWRVIRLDTYTPEFCEVHAKAVADHLNERWRQVRALLGQGRKKPAKLRCKVCDEVLTDAGADVPGVGRCCAGCVTLAQGEMVQDEQAAGPPKKKRSRRVAAVIG
jgi:hypothetical protein